MPFTRNSYYEASDNTVEKTNLYGKKRFETFLHGTGIALAVAIDLMKKYSTDLYI